jgi:hypothetical protein
MLFRRIRGLLTTATLSGLAMAGVVIAMTPVFFFARPNHGPLRELIQELIELVPSSFGLGATAGVIFALLVLVAERRSTLRSISERRFRIWGSVAGALAVGVVEARAGLGPHPSAMLGPIYAILGGAFSGGSLAPAMLWAARRYDVDSVSDPSGGRPPGI